MKIGFIVYEGMTALDFIGVYDPLTRLKTMGFVPELRGEICARSSEVKDCSGFRFIPERVGAPLGEYDVIIVPGRIWFEKIGAWCRFHRMAEECGAVPVKGVRVHGIASAGCGRLLEREEGYHPSNGIW